MLTRTMAMKGLLTGLVVALWLALFLMAATGFGAGLAMLAERLFG